jgi:hypothetical protein
MMKLLPSACLLFVSATAFQPHISHPHLRVGTRLQEKDSPVEEYRNAVTNVLSNFMNNDSAMKAGGDGETAVDPLGFINFDAPKVPKMSIEKLAAKLDQELYEKEWFVTGNVNPSFFSPNFEFQDPDVKLSGIEDYARGVLKLFNQETSRAEIISTDVVSPDTMTVTWRLSGKVNIGPGLNIKPYICYSDLKVDDAGLVCFQEDRFDIPSWDILVSALFPFLIGKVTAPPAPPVEPRTFSSSSSASPLDMLFEMFK